MSSSSVDVDLPAHLARQPMLLAQPAERTMQRVLPPAAPNELLMPPCARAHQNVRQVAIVCRFAIAAFVVIGFERANHGDDADAGEAASALEKPLRLRLGQLGKEIEGDDQ